MNIKIKTDNDAFYMDQKHLEIARLLREAADRIELGEVHFYLRDINGNKVGEVHATR